jgi:hypothetical protein
MVSKLKSELTSMESKVSKLGEEITVKNKSGTDTKLNSDPDTRTYKIVLVVPENADRATIDAAVTEFQNSNPGVTVEVKQEFEKLTEPGK